MSTDPTSSARSGYGQSVVGLETAGLDRDDTLDLGELLRILLRNSRLILVVTALAGLATSAWIVTRTPRFEASATLLLEPDEATGGVLSELASLTADPAAEAEIALIRSRSLAEVTARADDWEPLGDRAALFSATPADYDPFGPGAERSPIGVGLTTVVDAHDRRPWSTIVRRLLGARGEEHRLRAQVERLLGPDGAAVVDDEELPQALDVYFPEGGRTVRIAPHRRFFLGLDLSGELADGVLEIGAERSATAQTSATFAFDAFGLRLRLEAHGDFEGQRYRVTWVEQGHAVDRLMEATKVAEVGRKTNVVEIAYEDSCPYRAAETANALATNYIRRSVAIGQQKALRTRAFIDEQLSDKERALSEAAARLAEKQRQNPEAIAIDASAQAILERLTALELQRTQLELGRSILEEALVNLEQGDFEALARLGRETPNLLALAYIQELGALEAEALRLERTDVVGYKQLLQAEQLRLRGLIEERQLGVRAWEQALAALAAGEEGAVARFASAPQAARGDLDRYLESLAELDAEIARVSADVMDGNPVLVALRAGRSELIASIRAQGEAALAGQRSMLDGYRALYDDYTASIDRWPSEERSTIDAASSTLRQRVEANLRAQLAGVSDQVTSVSGSIADAEAALAALPAKQLELVEATRQVETLGQIVAFLARSEEEANITAAATSASAVLIDPAVPSEIRSFPKATLTMFLGLLLGAAVGAFAAIAKHFLQAALHSEAEVERATGLPVLGAIPDYERGRTRIRGHKKGERLLPLRDDPNGPQAEAYRGLRAAMRQSMRGEDRLRTLAVTSCTAGEGKTVTNADLALVFAKAGKRVLLVDCDLRKPQVHALFGTDRGPGFAEVLEARADWRECVRGSGVDDLDIIPAGSSTTNVGELLAADRAVDTLRELRDAYDLVVFDLPPAALVADVANFAANLDALLLVYRSGRVPGLLLRRTVNMLRQAQVPILGAVLNAVYQSRLGGGYGYGYGYEYRQPRNAPRGPASERSDLLE